MYVQGGRQDNDVPEFNPDAALPLTITIEAAWKELTMKSQADGKLPQINCFLIIYPKIVCIISMHSFSIQSQTSSMQNVKELIKIILCSMGPFHKELRTLPRRKTLQIQLMNSL